MYSTTSNDDNNDDDDALAEWSTETSGFEDYIPTAKDPGSLLFIITLIICLSSVYVLVCFVILSKQYDERKRKKKETMEQIAGISPTSNELALQESRSAISTGVSSVYTIHTEKTNISFFPPLPKRTRRHRKKGFGARHNAEKKERRIRHLLEEESRYEANDRHNRVSRNAQRKNWSEVHTEMGPMTDESLPTIRYAKSEIAGGMSRDDMVGRRSNEMKATASNVKLSTTLSPFRKGINPFETEEEDGEASSVGTPDRSCLSRIIDDISPNDAADANDPGITPPVVKRRFSSSSLDDDLKEGNITICCGRNALWRPRTLLKALNNLIWLSEYDHEMYRILKLTGPYCFGEMFEAIMEVVFASIIGHLIGIDAITVYVVVDVFLGTTGEFLGGVIDAEASLLSHAIGAGNNYLAGQYVQLSAFLYTILMIPCVVFWYFTVEALMIWLGFSPAIAVYAQHYANFAVYIDLIEGWGECIHSVLDVTDREQFGTVLDFIQGIVELCMALGILYLKEDPTLIDLAIMDLVLESIFTIFTIFYAGFYKPWLRPYMEGMTKNIALKNKDALSTIIRTALPLSIGSLLSYGEWEVITIFASYMGPAEVATWSLMGTVWDAFESATAGISDAAEVRVAYHLGKGNPETARISAYKSIYISVIISILITSIFLMIGQDLPLIFTNDPTLIQMINSLIPYIGLGNISLTYGMVCWSLIGGQGRYQIATLVQFLASWCVTMPLAAITTYVLKFNLEGITASLIIGYQIAGLAMTFLISRSDWTKISAKIQDINAVTGEVDSSDSENDDDSSKSSVISSSSDDSSSDSSSVHFKRKSVSERIKPIPKTSNLVTV